MSMSKESEHHTDKAEVRQERAQDRGAMSACHQEVHEERMRGNSCSRTNSEGANNQLERGGVLPEVRLFNSEAGDPHQRSSHGQGKREGKQTQVGDDPMLGQAAGKKHEIAYTGGSRFGRGFERHEQPVHTGTHPGDPKPGQPGAGQKHEQPVHTGTHPGDQRPGQPGADQKTQQPQQPPKSDITDSQGNRTIISADGRYVTYQGHDRTSYVRTLGEHGAFSEVHKGPKDADNYKLQHLPDGQGGYSERYEFAADPRKNYTRQVAGDGSEVRRDDFGNKTTISSDGRVVTYDGADGKSFVRKLDDKGNGYTEKHTGLNPEDNYTKEVRDGKTVLTDSAGLKMEMLGGSPEFQERMFKEMEKLPEAQRKLLAASGERVVVVGKMSDYNPDFATLRPRNHPVGTTWNDIDGGHDTKAIIVAESTNAGKSQRAEGVLKHETGHAVDAALKHFSQSPEFQQAYERDIRKISPLVAHPEPIPQQELLAHPELAAKAMQTDYLLPHTSVTPKDTFCGSEKSAGRQEAFAEVYAALNGSSATPAQTQRVLELFPETAALLRKKLAELK